MFDFSIILDNHSHTPLFEQLTAALRDAIDSGRLKPGEKFPSVRMLSSRLGISRATVIKSLEILYGQGYLASEPGKATTVSLPQALNITQILSEPTDYGEAEAVSVDGSPFLNRILAQDDLNFLPHLNYLAPPEDRLPLTTWRRVLKNACSSDEVAEAGYPQDPMGYLPLRQALSKF